MGDVDRLDMTEIDLQPKQARAIGALLVTPNMETAARETGVSVRTLRRWMDDPAFAAALKRASSQALNMAIHRLNFMADKALSALEQVLDDPQTPAYARSRAAADILGAVVRLRSLQNEETRLAEIEERLHRAETGTIGRWQRS